jgi:hypothetical protein
MGTEIELIRNDAFCNKSILADPVNFELAAQAFFK